MLYFCCAFRFFQCHKKPLPLEISIISFVFCLEAAEEDDDDILTLSAHTLNAHKKQERDYIV
jgi:hypothetical protein